MIVCSHRITQSVADKNKCNLINYQYNSNSKGIDLGKIAPGFGIWLHSLMDDFLLMASFIILDQFGQLS